MYNNQYTFLYYVLVQTLFQPCSNCFQKKEINILKFPNIKETKRWCGNTYLLQFIWFLCYLIYFF